MSQPRGLPEPQESSKAEGAIALKAVGVLPAEKLAEVPVDTVSNLEKAADSEVRIEPLVDGGTSEGSVQTGKTGTAERPTVAASAVLADGFEPTVGQTVLVTDATRGEHSPRGLKAAESTGSGSAAVQGVLVGTLMGRSVRVRLPAEEKGGQDEWLPAQVVGFDSGKNTVRVRYDDDPDTSEDLKVDSADLRIEPVAQQTTGMTTLTEAAGLSPSTAESPATTAQITPAQPEAKLAVEATVPIAAKAPPPAPAPVVPPKGDACVGWTVRVDLGDGISELGKVVSVNKVNGNLLVLFPELGDEPEECGVDEVAFVGMEI